MTPAIAACLDAYVLALDALMQAHYLATCPSLAHERVTVEVRKRYAKILIGGNRVYSYVDLVGGKCGKATVVAGSVLKGTWKNVESAVAHIPRGNVTDGSWLAWHGPHGIGYADRHGEFSRMLTEADYMVATDMLKEGRGEDAARVLGAAVRSTRGGS